MMTNAVDYRPLTTQNAINIMVNLYCTMFVLLTIFHVPYASFFIETNRRFATSQLNFGSLKSENWKILQEIRVYSLEKTNCDIWTGVLFQTARSIEYAALCTETYDMDIFRLIVIFFSFNFKGKRRRKKHEPLKFNGYSLVAKNTLHVRARPNHLSVCNVQISVSRLMGISHIVLTTRFFLPWAFTVNISGNARILVKVFFFVDLMCFFFHSALICPLSKNVAYSSMNIDDIWYDICST